MRSHHHRSPRTNQPDLFSPRPLLPTWQSLSPEIQRQIRQLLAKMLWAEQMYSQTEAVRMEVADE